MPDSGLIGVLGARSLVGACLLKRIRTNNEQVLAFTRNLSNADPAEGIHWQGLAGVMANPPSLPAMISVAPIWVLPDYFSELEAMGLRRLVVLSSTSRFTKLQSSSMEERAVARQIVDAEAALLDWAIQQGVELVILRPTLIYGYGQDRNIAEIQRFIRRFGFFPVFGKARGLRQPVHAEDVADACIAATTMSGEHPFACNIGGGEVLEYRAMVERVFTSMGLVPRLLPVPLGLFRVAVACLSIIPRYRKWTGSMAERMNEDMVFAPDEQLRALKFSPRSFQPD